MGVAVGQELLLAVLDIGSDCWSGVIAQGISWMSNLRYICRHTGTCSVFQYVCT